MCPEACIARNRTQNAVEIRRHEDEVPGCRQRDGRRCRISATRRGGTLSPAAACPKTLEKTRLPPPTRVGTPDE
jgi:hypothetical protein